MAQLKKKTSYVTGTVHRPLITARLSVYFPNPFPCHKRGQGISQTVSQNSRPSQKVLEHSFACPRSILHDRKLNFGQIQLVKEKRALVK